jgi:hypothetical protein
MALSSNPSIGKIKKIIKEKFQNTENPENGDEIVLVKELISGQSYAYEIGIGKCWKHSSQSFELVGYVFEESRHQFLNGNIKIEKKISKNTTITCGIAKKGLFEKVDKAALGFSGEPWDGSLESLIVILDKWSNN